MKNKLLIWSALLLGVITILVSCDKDVIIPSYKGFDNGYVTIRVGTQWVYQVDSIITQTARPALHLQYFTKEEVVDSSLEGSSVAYIVEKSKGLSENGSFKPVGTYKLVISENRIIRMGFGQNIIALHSPLTEGSKWNNLNNQCYYSQSTIKSVQDTKMVLGNEYEEVVEINHCQNYQFDIRKNHNQTWAKNVGLIEEIEYNGFYNRLAGVTTGTTVSKSLLTYAY